MNRPRVYIVHEPKRFDQRSRELVSAFNVKTAAEFGDITYILSSANRPPIDPEASLPAIRKAMALFKPQDYLLLIGDMNLVAWAGAIAARATDGVLNLLRWDNVDKRYVAFHAKLWETIQ